MFKYFAHTTSWERASEAEVQTRKEKANANTHTNGEYIHAPIDKASLLVPMQEPNKGCCGADYL